MNGMNKPMETTLIFGANSAIAKAYARRRANKGDRIILVGRNSEKLEILKQDLETRGAHAEAHAHDLNQVQGMESWIMAFGKIDRALIAHGILGNQREDEKSIQQTLGIQQTNFISPIAILTVLSNQMETAGSGKIGVISSVAGDRGRQSNYIYGASKAGLSVFTDGLRNRLAPKGVHVCLIKPGFVDTPMTANYKKGALWAQPESIAAGIDRAMEWRKDVAYLPAFWCLIMAIIRMIPEKIFKRMKL